MEVVFDDLLSQSLSIFLERFQEEEEQREVRAENRSGRDAELALFAALLLLLSSLLIN